MSREEPINFSLTTADHILDATDHVLYKANRLLKNIYKIGRSQKSFENTLLPLDNIGNIIENVWSPVSLLAFTHPDKGIRDSGLKASQKIEEFLNSISVDEKLYNAIDIFSNNANGKMLTGLKKKFLVETLRDFNRSGFSHGERVRNQVKTILNQLTPLSLKFEKNISESKDTAPTSSVLGNAYGLSKACANALTLILARENPGLTINACTPGFIETDMTRPFAESQGKTATEMGMNTPEQGSAASVFLIMGEVPGSGMYFGSDCLRSPLDRYRSPGDPPYEGD